jgi:hypothetical protein
VDGVLTIVKEYCLFFLRIIHTTSIMADGSDDMLNEEVVLDIEQTVSDDSAQELMIRRSRCGLLDGVNLADPHSYLPRDQLVQEAIDMARLSGLLIVSSPPGTGKTSLIQLIIQNLAADNTRSCKGFILRPSQPGRSDFDLYKWVNERTGVSYYDDRTLKRDLETYSEVWLLFDDAQKLYENKFHDFWEDVVKTRSSIGFGDQTKVVVVVSATYYLTTGADSPVSFQNEQRIGMNALLLSQSEASDLFDLRSLYPQWQACKATLFYLTNGNAAAFAIGLNLISEMSLSVEIRTGGGLSESRAMEELVEGGRFLARLSRCFPAISVDASSHRIIFDAIVEAYRVDAGEFSYNSSAGGNPVISLQKAGILAENNRFTSPAAQRFYYSTLFPRATLSTEPPGSLEKLVIQATSTLSARRLRVSRQKNTNGEIQTPKEAVYQQLFHEAISAILPTSYRIIPELGTEALIGNKFKTGELDFYIKNGHKWALEFLRNGEKIGEHLGRIPGKYKNVVADEWLVVDCRIEPSFPKKADHNRCSLVFSQDFTSCQCFMRLDTLPSKIQLMD